MLLIKNVTIIVIVNLFNVVDNYFVYVFYFLLNIFSLAVILVYSEKLLTHKQVNIDFKILV